MFLIQQELKKPQEHVLGAGLGNLQQKESKKYDGDLDEKSNAISETISVTT